MTTQSVQLSSPKIAVTIGNVDDPDTWTTTEVQTIGRDMVHAETLFGVQKIGRTIDHPVRSLVAMAYYAMLRTGKYSGPFDAFEDEYIEITPIGVDVAYPTDPGHAPG